VASAPGRVQFARRDDSDIEYFYKSKLQTEGAPVEDIHFHPVEPRTVRLTLTAHF